MAFICIECAGPSGVTESEKFVGMIMPSYGPCECCGVVTDCIDSDTYTSLTNGRTKTEGEKTNQSENAE